MGWLTHDGTKFAAKRVLPIGAFTPYRSAHVDVTLTKDDYIRSVAGQEPHNMGGEVYWYLFPVTGNLVRAPLECDISETVAGLPAGYVLTKAELYVDYYSFTLINPSGQNIKVKELGQTFTHGTGTEALPAHNAACWNTYDGVNAWPGGVGAMGDTVGDAVSIDGATLGSYGWKTWTITDIVQGVIDDHPGAEIVRLLMYYATENTATNHLAYFYSMNNASATLRPYIRLTYAYTPATPPYYKLPITVHKGSPTVQPCDETVNGKTYHWYFEFTVTAMSATAAGYSGVDVVIDTAKLLDDVGGPGGTNRFFGGTDSSYASTVEFVQVDGADVVSNVCKYTMKTALGLVQNWDTDHTPYTIRIPLEMDAREEWTFRLYFDAEQVGQSTNFLQGAPDSAAGTWNFFRDFSTNVTLGEGLAHFLEHYPEWEVKKTVGGADPTAAVATSVLTVTGGEAAKWSGLRTLLASFNATNFKVRIRFTENPGVNTWAGMSGGADMLKSGCWSTGNANEIAFYYADGVSNSQRDLAYPASGAWTLELRKYGAYYRYVYYRDSANGTPDYWTMTNDWIMTTTADDVAHMPYVGAYGTGHQHIDSIAVGDYVWTEPIVFVPNITYDQPGVAFGENENINWPYDLGFTASNGTSELYWWPDQLSEKSKHPGNVIDVIVRTTALDAIDVYHGHAAITEADPNPFCDPVQVFADANNLWDDYEDARMGTIASVHDTTHIVTTAGDPHFVVGDVGKTIINLTDISSTTIASFVSDHEVVLTAITGFSAGHTWAFAVTDYTAVGSGMWAAKYVAEPTFRRGDVGNVPMGGGGGRTWDRMPNVVKWDADKYIQISNGSNWSGSGAYWPCDFDIQISFGTSINGEFGAAKRAFNDPVNSGEGWGLLTTSAVVATVGAVKKLFVFYNIFSNTGGSKVASTTDPYADPIVWTFNDNVWCDTTWLAAQGIGGVMNYRSGPYIAYDDIDPENPFWRLVFSPNTLHWYYCHTTESPDDWDNASFTTVVAPIINSASITGGYSEDVCLVYDRVSKWYLYITTLNTPAMRYFDSLDFVNWGVEHTPTVTLGPWALVDRSPRIAYDDSDSYFHLHYAGVLVDTANWIGRWIPNLTGCNKCATLDGPWTAENLHNKAFLANTTGLHFAYKNTFNCPQDFEYVSEVLQVTGGNSGLIFRYDEDLHTGYLVFLSWVSGDPTLNAWKIVADTLVAFSPAQSYTIPLFPLPRFYPGYTWRLYVQCVGDKAKIGYSPWGNEIVWGLTLTGLLCVGDRIALAANVASTVFDKSRVRPIAWDISNLEPQVGSSTMETISSASGSVVAQLMSLGLL